jgi:hypothetical protein
MTYKQWTTGDVLTASDQNALSDQVINRFADATARDAAIGSPTDGQMCFLTGSSALQYNDGSSWISIDLAGDITGITTAANSSMAGGTTTGNATLTVDVNNTTSATATAADYVLIADTDDSNATKRALISDITALAGDIQGVTAGVLLDGGGTSGTVTLDVDLSEAATSTSDGDGDFFIVVDASNGQHKLTKANIALSGFNNDSGFAAGTVTSVTGTSPVASSGGTTPAISVDTQDANFVLAGQVFSG